LSPLSARNLLLFTTVRSVWAVTFGLIGPFYIVYIAGLSGGMEKLGIAFSIMVLCQSLTAYLAGRFSDKLGRRPFLIATAYVDTIILLLYTVIHETHQLYLLQGMLGITNGIMDTISTSLLGDLTIREKRGRTVGKFNAIVGLSSAVGLSVGGYLVKYYGIKSLFYLAALVVALTTVLLFFIKERDDSDPSQPPP